MKYAIAAIAVLAAAFGPVAHAQVACSDVEASINYGLDDFQEIVGDEVEGNADVYAVSFELPGADGCTVRYDLDSYYFCLWNFADEGSARSTYGVLAGMVNDCLSSWSTTPVLDKVQLPEGMKSYIVRSGSDEYEGMEAVVHVDRFLDPDTSDVTWEVWYELTYYVA